MHEGQVFSNQFLRNASQGSYYILSDYTSKISMDIPIVQANGALHPDHGPTAFVDAHDVDIPRELIDAWKGETIIDFKRPQVLEKEDGSMDIEYAIEVTWQVEKAEKNIEITDAIPDDLVAEEMAVPKKKVKGTRLILRTYESFKEFEFKLWELERKRPWRDRCSFAGIGRDEFTGFGVDKLNPDGPFCVMRKQKLEDFTKDSIMAQYDKFGIESKCTIDEFFEVDIIMKDYYEHVHHGTRLGSRTIHHDGHGSFLSNLGFLSLTQCCYANDQ